MSFCVIASNYHEKHCQKKIVRIDTKKAFGLITTSILGTGKCQEI